jgi:DNA-binding NtrC family response regulator
MDYTILIVDDEEEWCRSLSTLLAKHDLNSIYTISPFEAVDIVLKENIDLIILDIKMPQMGGLDLLRKLKEINASIPIIMVTGHGSIYDAVIAMKYGAADFFTKPLNNAALIEEIKQFAHLKLEVDNQQLPIKIIMKSTSMIKIVEEIKTVAPTDASILLTGASGTGKELLAELIHNLSKRKNDTLIKINCASIPETLLESQLFGHEAGAFTDAKKDVKGMFELATDGTLFLDEIGDMSMALQPKLLRVLQDGVIQPLGSEKTITVTPRIISATNRDLNEAIDEGCFRDDLFFRISVISFHLPSLKERKEDIMELASHFVSQFNQRYKKNVTGISKEVTSILLAHSWPGNIRELRNCIERAVIFAKGMKLQIADLPSQYRKFEDLLHEDVLSNIVNILTREQIEDALEKSQGIKYKAAEMLNISRKTLYTRMKKVGLE